MYQNFTFDYFPTQFYAPTIPVGRYDSVQSIKPIMTGRLKTIRRPVSFARLVAETGAHMTTHGGIAETVDAKFAKRNSLHGNISLEASEWTLRLNGRSIANLRMVYISGTKNQIINTWIFPNRPHRMPVYAAELIAVGEEVRVAFIDVQIPAIETGELDDVERMTGALSPRFAGLPCNEEPPTWAIESSQGNYTYARNVPEEKLSTIEDCYLSYLDAYLCNYACHDVAMSISLLDRDEDALKTLHQYQVHHMEHSPGKKFLSKLFGSDWTDAFMKEFLFTKPRG